MHSLKQWAWQISGMRRQKKEKEKNSLNAGFCNPGQVVLKCNIGLRYLILLFGWRHMRNRMNGYSRLFRYYVASV